MKRIIRDYTAFNTWANNRICREIATLSEEQFLREMNSSFRNIRQTVIHIWDAQDIWLERFEGTSPSSWPSASFDGDKNDLLEELIYSSEQLQRKAASYGKKELKKKVAYTTMKGNNGNSPVYQMFLHVVNHGTYHRGQLVSMLREVGRTEIPPTDLIAFFREQHTLVQ